MESTDLSADIKEYEDHRHRICDKIQHHVAVCKLCQRRLSFDPIEKSLLKTHSVRQEIFELVALLGLGTFIIAFLYILQSVKSS